MTHTPTTIDDLISIAAATFSDEDRVRFSRDEIVGSLRPDDELKKKVKVLMTYIANMFPTRGSSRRSAGPEIDIRAFLAVLSEIVRLVRASEIGGYASASLWNAQCHSCICIELLPLYEDQEALKAAIAVVEEYAAKESDSSESVYLADCVIRSLTGMQSVQ